MSCECSNLLFTTHVIRYLWIRSQFTIINAAWIVVCDQRIAYVLLPVVEKSIDLRVMGEPKWVVGAGVEVQHVSRPSVLTFIIAPAASSELVHSCMNCGLRIHRLCDSPSKIPSKRYVSKHK